MKNSIALLTAQREQARKCLTGLLRDNSGDLRLFNSFTRQFVDAQKAINVLKAHKD